MRASAQQSNLFRTRQLSLLEVSVELLLGIVNIRLSTATSESGGTYIYFLPFHYPSPTLPLPFPYFVQSRASHVQLDTSPLAFQRATLKSWEEPGDEASSNHRAHSVIMSILIRGIMTHSKW